MSYTDCKCGGKYKQSKESFDEHSKNSKKHLEFMSSIEVVCGCGERYTYASQNNHFRSQKHKSWQDNDTKRFDNVLYICRCGEVMRYGKRDLHLKSHPQ